MIKKSGWIILGLALTLIVSACSRRGVSPTPGQPLEGLAVVERVEVLLLESFPVQVHVLVQGDLPDGCTTLAEWSVSREGNAFRVTLPTARPKDAICTQALVSYEVTIPLDVAGLSAGTYTVTVNDSKGTDGAGANSATFTLVVDNVAVNEQPEVPLAAEGARFVLSQVLGITDIEIVSVQPVEWHNACMGLAQPEELCAAVITPGAIVTLAAGDAVYVYHADETGGSVRLAQAPPVALDAPVLAWQNTFQGECGQLLLSLDRGAAGRCGAPMIAAPLRSDWVQRNLPEFVATYAPFRAETVAGTVVFTGTGALVAAPVEQRMLAEFARIAAGIVEGGREGASYGRALALHREGGLAGICEDFEITVSGEVFISSCRGATPERLAYGRLTMEELTQLYALLDSTAFFEWSDPTAIAYDGLAQELAFMGRGAAAGGEGELQALLDLVSALHTRLVQR